MVGIRSYGVGMRHEWRQSPIRNTPGVLLTVPALAVVVNRCSVQRSDVQWEAGYKGSISTILKG